MHLAGAAHGQGFEEHHIVRHPPLGHLGGQEVEDFLLLQRLPGLAYDEQQWALVPLGVLDADDRGHGHGGVTDGGVFQVDRADPLAPGLDHVLGAVADLHGAARVDGGDVARGEPAVHQRGFVGLVVALHDPLAAHHQLALRCAVAGQGGTVFIDDLDFDARDGFALFGHDGVLFGRWLLAVGAAEVAHGGHGGRFGHSPAVAHFHAIGVHELGDQRHRHGRAAYAGAPHAGEAQIVLFCMLNQAHPDGRHARTDGDLLGLHQLKQAGAVELGAGQDQLGA